MRNMSCRHHIVCLAFFCIMVSAVLVAEAELVPLQVIGWQKAAQEYAAKSDLTQAVLEYQKIIQAFPNTASAVEAQGQIVCLDIQAGKTDDAKAQLDQLWTNCSNSPAIGDAAAAVAESYCRNKQPEDALAVCRKAMQLPACKESLSVKRVLITTCLETNQQAEADAITEKLMAQCSDSPAFKEALNTVGRKYRWTAKYPAKGRQLYVQWLAKYKTDPDAFKMQCAVVKTYLEEKNSDGLKAAVDTYKQLCAGGKPDEVYAESIHLATVLNEKQCPVQSLDLCQYLDTAYPGHANAAMTWALMIDNHLQQKEKDRADAILDELMAKDSENPAFKEVLFKVAQSYDIKAKDRIKGRQLYTLWLDKYKTEPETFKVQRAIVKTYLEEKDAVGAAAAMEDLQVRYNYVDAKIQTDMLLQLQQQSIAPHQVNAIHQKILEKCQLLISDPILERQFCGHAGIGFLAINEEQDAVVDEKVKLATTVYKSHEDVDCWLFAMGEAYYLRGEKLMREGKPEESKTALIRATEIWEKNTADLADMWRQAMSAYYSGVVYKYLDDTIKALECFQKVAVQYPNYDQAWHARYMVAQCAEKLSAEGTMDVQTASQVKLTAYQDLLQNDPNCPVADVVRKQMEMQAQ